MQDLSERAAKHGRTMDFGMRLHVIVRETEEEAKQYAKELMSKFDAETAEKLKSRTQDSKSAGVLRQDEFRKEADADDFIEPMLWGGIGRARSGCGAALVGSPEQIIEKINRYMDMGVRSFILSGYPLKEECELFGKLVLPNFKNSKLSVLQGRTPAQEPATPLTHGELKLW
jgi:alkanesulfonate monooxygenase